MIARGWRLYSLMRSREIGNARVLYERLCARGERMSYAQLARLVKGDFESIRVSFLEELCGALSCEPNDLFDFEGVTLLRRTDSAKRPAILHVARVGGALGKLGAARPVGAPLSDPLTAGRKRRGA